MKNITSRIFVGLSIFCGFLIKGIMESNDKLIAEIRVEGRAEQKIKANLFEWVFVYQAVGNNVQEVKLLGKNAKKEIIEMLVRNGLVKDKDFIVKPKQLKNTKTDDGKDVFIISQEYEVKTQKLSEAEKAYKNSGELVDINISITNQNTDIYKVKDRTDLEKRLLKQALDDSRNKAERIAEMTGGNIIGLPTTSWSYITIKDANTSDDSNTNGTSIDQIGVIQISTTYKMKQK